ncbi:hypothetical protein BC830DRAFT_1081097 [Chytriomyces sp. MP71]|nr:hypothetical protein BC830DRAFT_1081097 [Chytriomyces sp. MP71]
MTSLVDQCMAYTNIWSRVNLDSSGFNGPPEHCTQDVMDAMIDLYNNCRDPQAAPFTFATQVPSNLGSIKYRDPFSMQQVCQGLGISLSTARVAGTAASPTLNPQTSQPQASSAASSSASQPQASLASQGPQPSQQTGGPQPSSNPLSQSEVPQASQGGTTLPQGSSQITSGRMTLQTTSRPIFATASNTAQTTSGGFVASKADGTNGVSPVAISLGVIGGIIGIAIIACIFAKRQRRPATADAVYILPSAAAQKAAQHTVQTPSVKLSDVSEPFSVMHQQALAVPVKSQNRLETTLNEVYTPRSTSSRGVATASVSEFVETEVQSAGVFPSNTSSRTSRHEATSFTGGPSTQPLGAPETWTIEQAATWASNHPLLGAKFSNVIRENQVNGSLLLTITRQEMKQELGLVFGEVVTFANAVNELRGGASGTEEPPVYAMTS